MGPPSAKHGGATPHAFLQPIGGIVAAELAEKAGLTVIMNRCPKIEYARLSGELGWSGINSRIITAKSLRPPKA